MLIKDMEVDQQMKRKKQKKKGPLLALILISIVLLGPVMESVQRIPITCMFTVRNLVVYVVMVEMIMEEVVEMLTMEDAKIQTMNV